MLCKINDFEKKTPSDIVCESTTLKCGQEVNVYTIESVHDLIQFIGFGKYINNKHHNVLLRGQTQLYDGALIPSLYRERERLDSITQKYNKRMNDIRKNVKSFTQYERIILEPLLQHYGIKTPFIDLVDNVWVALWFALHQAKCKTINSREYIYYYNNDREYSYIMLVATDAVTLCDDNGGVYEGTETKLVDLRKALPSYFLRPHAQHAYMIRKNESYPEDSSDLIIGIAKIPTVLGLKWLGQNDFLTVSSLFPAAYFDSGYAVLLKQYPEEQQGIVHQYGSIQIITD